MKIWPSWSSREATERKFTFLIDHIKDQEQHLDCFYLGDVTSLNQQL